MKRKQHSVRSLLIVPVLLAQGAASASAADITWSGGTSSYNNAGSWAGGVVPGLADAAINDKGTNNIVLLNAGDPDWVVGRIQAGKLGGGAFRQSGQTLTISNTARAFLLGSEIGSQGVYTMNGGTLDAAGSDLIVGELGIGILNVNGGSIVSRGLLAINVGTTLNAVNATMDGGLQKTDFTWFEQGFFPEDPSRGLPAAGSTFTHESLADHSYKMAPSYSQNSSVMLSAGVTNATISFSAQTPASSLSFLASSGNGPVLSEYKIYHADNTVQTGTLEIPDWFNNDATVAFRVGGRVRSTGFDFQIINDGPNKPYLFSIDLPVSNAASAISKIELKYVSGGVACIAAVSASSGGNYQPVAFTGYNADMVMNGSVYVDSSITDVFNQTGGSVATTGEMWVGNYGSGVYNLSGGTNTISNWTAFGRSGGSGTFNMTGGEFNKMGNGSLLIGSGFQARSGSTPSGVLNHSAGVINSQNAFLCPENFPATGAYNISGTAVLNVNEWFVIGRNGGSGTMTMTGGVINKTGGGNFAIGDGADAIGYADQTAGTVNVAGGELFVGQNNSLGTYDLKGGSVSVNNWVAIGRDNGTGIVNLSGGTFTKTGNENNHLIIGASGPGTLNQTGGELVSTNSETWLGERRPGTWTLSSGTARLAALQLARETGSEGSFTMDGGVLEVKQIRGGGGFSSVNLNGGKIVATGSSEQFLQGLTQVNIGGAGLTIDSAGFNIVAAQALLNNGGGVTKEGLGSLILAGPNTYAGATVVSAGKLITSTASTGGGDLTVAQGAGSGVIVVSANAQFTAQNVTLGAGSSLDFDLGAFGNPTVAPLNVPGNLAVGGVTTVNIADGFPQVGKFPLIAYGSRSGAGNFVLGALPVGVNATISTEGNTVVIEITNVNLPRWSGTAGGTWDIGATANWVNIGTGLPTYYGEGNLVLFDDNAEGDTTVNLTTTVRPGNVTANNSVKPYTLTGTGKINGNTGFTKQGSAPFAVASSVANTYTGPTVINGGSLIVSNLANGGAASAIGASSAHPTNLVISAGALSYAGAPVAINRGYSILATNSTIDVQTSLGFGGQVSAAPAAGLIKTGPGVLAYVNTVSNLLSGGQNPGLSVVQGTVKFDGAAGAQTNRIMNEVWIGSTPDFGGSLELTNSTLLIDSWLGVGRGNGSSGNLSTLTLKNSLLSANGISFGWWRNLPGNFAFQTVTLSGTSVLTNRGGNTMDIASSGGSTTTVNINDNSILGSNSRLVIGLGNTATGIVTIANSGAVMINSYLSIANEDGGVGSVTVKDNGFIRSQGDFNVSDTGSSFGSLTLQDNAVANGGSVWVGKVGTSIGKARISGSATLTSRNDLRMAEGSTALGEVEMLGGSVFISDEFWVGESGTGNWNQSGGTVWSTNWVAIGRNGSGIGTYNISGGSLNEWNTGARLIVGANGNGTLNMTGTAQVSSRGSFQIAEGSASTGLVNLGAGTTLTVPRIYGGAGQSTLNFNGGTLVAASGANADFMSGIKNVNVVSDAKIDSGAGTITIANALLDGGSGGGLTKLGTGTLYLNGANTYTGPTVVSAGALGGNGAIAGALSVTANGTLAPGNSIGTLTVNNGVTLAGAVVMEVGKVGDVVSSDLLVAAGNIAFGGTLNVVVTGSAPLAVNDTFNLFDFATRNGTFSQVYLPGGYLWDTSNLYVDGTIRVSAVVPPGPDSAVVTDGTLVLTGSGGAPGASYTWLTSTNAAAPIADWTTNTTGVFDASGSYSNAITIDKNETSRFYRLKLP